MDVAYSVLIGLALAVGPAAMMVCLFGWLGWKWFQHEVRCINKLMDDILEGKYGEQD
jgi:hypothetical protein